ncbi:SulP family inorganic anion transporter [Robiginitomaculum antarcticum]|uniref:SulP family inorganic anion transporter n=1 Tax=Robiginitomaculum antarcticum TaxID=437507 RepID=UPI00036B640A|nr:sulfate permease [Robiginitomaculum antarcticum]
MANSTQDKKSGRRIIFLPSWLMHYSPSVLPDDIAAAIIVTVLLVPQSLAYALLAGLPAQMGIYAAILPLLVYAMLGTSRHMSVGPTAVISLMTAAAIASVPEGMRVEAAAMLAVLAGLMMLGLGLLKSGAVMNFVSRPVVSAYVTGAAILIMISQLRHIFGVSSNGNTALELLRSMLPELIQTNLPTLYLGAGAIVFLLLVRRYAAFGFYKLGVPPRGARLMARFGPFVAVIFTVALSYTMGLSEQSNVAVVGIVPSGLPRLDIPSTNWAMYRDLILAAFLIGLVGFVDGMSTAQTLAARSRSRIVPDREMIALGVANISAGISGGYPVNASMSRSAVNFSAGAKTQMAGVITAALMCLTAVFLTPLLYHLPLATLAALIIVACFSLFDFRHLWRTWQYSKADGLTAFATFMSVLVFGIEIGVLVGVILSMAIHIRLTLRPHAVLVGRFPGTEHYRDASRYNVETSERIKTLRIDESLYFANARFLEDRVAELVEQSPHMKHLVLMCPAVNRIDASALNSLMSINKRLDMAGAKLHLSELHSHVKDRLHRSTFFKKLTGEVFLSQHDAMEALAEEPDWAALSDHIDIH